MSIIYGSAKYGNFTMVRYTHEQLVKPGVIEDIINRGYSIYPMTDDSRTTRDVNEIELANPVKSIADLQSGLFRYQLGLANGLAPLDENSIVVNDNLADGIVEYKGTWNPITNEPLLVDGIGRSGDMYFVGGLADGETYDIDLGNGVLTVANEDMVRYREGKHHITTASDLSTHDRELLYGAMSKLKDYEIISPLETLVVPFGTSRFVQVKADSIPYPEFYIHNHGGLSNVSIHPSSGELYIDSANDASGTYSVDVRVGGRLGQSERFYIYVQINEEVS